jgi:non-canonical (house-cleaning) NTP pyrophosphatase
MKIALGTTRSPKIEWIKKWIQTCPYFQDILEEIIYLPQNVESGISDMPLSIEEVMLWAKNRAKNLKPIESADYYIWIEWGTTAIWEKKYIFWVVYIENNSWEGHYGFSPMLEVPSIVEKKLYDEWQELGPLMGELSGNTNIRSENGSLWAWTNDMLTRTDEFYSAFQAAISPFYNDYYKM